MSPIYLATSVVPDRSATFTLTVIIAGLGIVLATLALLIVIFNAFGSAVNFAQKRAEKKSEKAEIEPPAPPRAVKSEVPLPPPESPANGVTPEVVAAISAAVYMLEGEGAKITSITPKKAPQRAAGNPWAMAATMENTKPF